MTEKVELEAERATLLITLRMKAIDNQADEPVLGDATAERVLAEIDYDFRGNLGKATWDTALPVVTRTKRIDEWASAFLAEHPGATVLHLGCGLDSRAERIGVGPDARWHDVDHPEVIELRRRLLGEPPGTRLVGSSVTDPGWLADIAQAAPADQPVLAIAEGLLMYLEPDGARRLVRGIADAFGDGQLCCDILAPWQVRVAGLSKLMRTLGTSFRWGTKDLRELEAWDPRLRLVEEASLVAMPELARASAGYRAMYRAMSAVPSLRETHRLARYELGPVAR